jgi:hypothetical protein
MPVPLKTLAGHLTSQHGSPPGVAVMAILSAVGAAVGRTITFTPWPGLQIPAALNVVFSATKPSTSRLVEEAFAPILARQLSRGQEFRKRSRPWLEQESIRLYAERSEYRKQFQGGAWSGPTPFNERLVDIQLVRYPAVLHNAAAEDPRGARVPEFQTRLLTNAERAFQHVHQWMLPWSAGSCAHPRAGFRDSGSFSCSGSDVVVSNQVDVGQFLGAGRAASWLSGELLIVSDQEDPAPREGGSAQDGPEYCDPNDWDDRLNQLFERRLAYKTAVIEPTPEAVGILNASLRTTPGVFSELPPDRRGISILWPQQVQRLALALHLACGSTGDLSAETARAAEALAAWLAVQQVAAGFPQHVDNPAGDENELRLRKSLTMAQ